MMWMWFHTAVNKANKTTVLFKDWTITDVQTMIWSCVVVIMWGVVLEMVRWLRWVVITNKSPVKSIYLSWFSGSHWLDALLFALQTILSLTLMLFFMTFSLYLCLSCSLGLSIGFFFFGSRKLTY